MSQENVEAVPIRAAYEAIDQLNAEALVNLCDPEVRFESRITALEDTEYEGHDGVRRYIANLTEAFEWVEVESTDLVTRPGCATVTNRLSW